MKKRKSRAQIKRTKFNKRIALLVYTITVMHGTALVGERFNQADNDRAIMDYLTLCLEDKCPDAQGQGYSKMARSEMDALIIKTFKNM